MSAATVYLALGSNLGDRRAHLSDAIRQLGKHVNVEQPSSIYETEPAYVTDQPRFYNMVLRGTTSLSPEELLRFVKNIEQQMGRITTQRYGPRPIDIDILVYGDLQLDQPDLTIPHPLITERAFVLMPLAEIAPNLVLPGQQDTVEVLAEQVDMEGEVLNIIKDQTV
jgi:2-amino-4-hydroxy-6-hydroxymethyldihydropteridine diphosphokinase